MLVPFHERKVCHHTMSALAPLFRWTQCKRSLTEEEASMRLRRKARPGFTTFAAWLKWPIRDSNSRFLQDPLGDWLSARFIQTARFSES